MRNKKIISLVLILTTIISIFSLPASAAEKIENQITVYYYNENNWESPYIYYYCDNLAPVTWPGKQMNDFGDGWYSYTINNLKTAKVIFSDNGANQNPAQNQEGYSVEGEKWYKKGTWYKNRPEIQTTKIHYYNENGWSEPYIYYYSNNEKPVNWPGTAMNSDGGNWYSFSVNDVENVKVIFSNNGANQNPSQNQEGYSVSGEKWYLNGSWYDSEPNGITVHFNNYNDWDNVNIYYYSGNKTGTSWTGNPMIPDGDGWYTYKIYGFDEAKVLFNNGKGIQIPGQNQEGFAVSGEMWYRNGGWTAERPDDVTVYFYKPDNWSAPNIYYYKDINDTGKAWPGNAMSFVRDNWYSYTITKYSSAKVLFNSGSNQIPPQNQPGFDVKGIVWYKDGVMCNAETDADNDGLPDYMEMVLGTNLNNKDTDSDGLPDGYEVLTLGTDPLKADTDGNGVKDSDEDADGDKLTNLEEYKLDTSPINPDTDGDGLNDYEEVYTYHTDPLNADTDGDGLSDGKEINFNYNPNLFDEKVDVFVENKTDDEKVIPSVTINGISPSQAEDLSINPVDDFVLLDENIPGSIGKAFDFSMEGVFDTATITFSFNSELLKLDNFKPCIYYYNEDTQLLEELPDQTIKDNTVSVNTTHFSKYILLNKYSYDEVWKEDIRKPSENYNNMDIVFVVDISFSMSYNDPEYIRKTVTNGFVNNLRNGDRAALVTFRKNAEIKQKLTDNKNDIVNAVNVLHNDDGYNDFSGTNGSLGLYTAYKLFDDKVNTDKVIIFLTDGEDTEITYDYNNIISQAADNNICIYTIGLGSSIDGNLLKMIASKTHGKYYKSDVATDLITDFDAIFNEYTDYYTDSNNDGISDYFTALMCSGVLVTGTGKKLFQGIPMSEIQKNSDYDNDGIKNGDEVKVIFDSKHKKVYLKVISSPVENDTDKDGVKDNIDQNKLKKDIYENGAVVYNNLVYPIVVPDCRKTYLDSTDWKTDFENHDKRITKSILEFVVGSLSGMNFDDNTDLKSQGIYAGPVILNNIQSEKKVDCMLGSIFSSIEGVSNNLEKVYDDIKINIILQSSTSQRRAFIQAGTYKNSSIYNQYAGSIPYSAFWDSCGGFTFSGSVMSNNISKVYKTLTGDTTDYGTYDINIFVDKRHKDEEYSSYLWINKEKKLVENPKIYSGDRVEIVQLNFFGSRKKSLYSLPISTTCKVSNEYRAFFDDFLTDNNLKWCV